MSWMDELQDKELAAYDLQYAEDALPYDLDLPEPEAGESAYDYARRIRRHRLQQLTPRQAHRLSQRQAQRQAAISTLAKRDPTPGGVKEKVKGTISLQWRLTAIANAPFAPVALGAPLNVHTVGVNTQSYLHSRLSAITGKPIARIGFSPQFPYGAIFDSSDALSELSINGNPGIQDFCHLLSTHALIIPRIKFQSIGGAKADNLLRSISIHFVRLNLLRQEDVNDVGLNTFFKADQYQPNIIEVPFSEPVVLTPERMLVFDIKSNNDATAIASDGALTIASPTPFYTIVFEDVTIVNLLTL